MSKGKKICPRCKNEFGARLKKCPCGYIFQEKQVKEANPVDLLLLKLEGDVEYIVTTPGQKLSNVPKAFCPISCPRNKDEETLKKWIADLRGYRFIVNGKVAKYSNSAIIYFAGIEFGPTWEKSEAYKKVVELVGKEV